MTTPAADGSSDATGDAPFLPPARPPEPAPVPGGASSTEPRPAPTASPAHAPADAPFLPNARPPEPAPSPTAAPVFDAKALVESQKHVNTNPTYGALPAGTAESRAAARKLREQANRKRRRGKVVARVVAIIVVAGLAVGAYFAYRAIQDDPPPLDGETADDGGSDDPGDSGDGGALTPVGEHEQVIEALDDLNTGARPSAGGLLDAVDDARDAVGQAEPPVAAPSQLVVDDVFTPAVLDHTDVLDPAGGYERFVVRAADLTAINPSAHDALAERLLALPQVADGDAQLEAAPVVLPGDIGIAIRRDGDSITTIVAVATDPVIRTVGP